MLRWLLLFLCVVAWSQDFAISPRSVRQGETIQVHGPKGLASARLNTVTVPLFPDADAGSFGLMPVKPDLKPGEYRLEFINGSGAVAQELAVTVVDAHYRKQNVVLPPATASLESSPEERTAYQSFLKQISSKRFWQEPLKPPVAGCMTSPFGVERLNNGVPTGDRHGGIDQRAGLGAPVRAVAGGVVHMAGQYTLRGGAVGLDHGQGLQSMYLHLSKVTVADGRQVQAGEIIGRAGSTGRSTGPHLHWSLYANGQPVNPAQWMTVPACSAGKSGKRAKSGK
jgi:murein DD-endopeptidase MepM/ murein hydrolase activator NlpD